MLPDLMKIMALSPYFASKLRDKNGSNFLTMNHVLNLKMQSNKS